MNNITTRQLLMTTTGEGRALVIAPLSRHCHSRGAYRYMAHTKQRRTYLPYTFPAAAGTHLPTPRGWRVKPRPRVQRATGPRLLRDRPQPALDSNQRPRGRWLSALTTRLSGDQRTVTEVTEKRRRRGGSMVGNVDGVSPPMHSPTYAITCENLHFTT